MNRTGTKIVSIALAWLMTAGMLAGMASPVHADPEPVAVLQQMTEHVTDVVRRDTGILKDPVRLRAACKRSGPAKCRFCRAVTLGAG